MDIGPARADVEAWLLALAAPLTSRAPLPGPWTAPGPADGTAPDEVPAAEPVRSRRGREAGQDDEYPTSPWGGTKGVDGRTVRLEHGPRSRPHAAGGPTAAAEAAEAAHVRHGPRAPAAARDRSRTQAPPDALTRTETRRAAGPWPAGPDATAASLGPLVGGLPDRPPLDAALAPLLPPVRPGAATTGAPAGAVATTSGALTGESPGTVSPALHPFGGQGFPASADPADIEDLADLLAAVLEDSARTLGILELEP